MKNYIGLIIILLSLMQGNAYAGDIDKSKANKIKASLLYNMTKMITWPKGSFLNNEPISILFLGADTNGIGGYFVSEARSRSLIVKGRKLVVKQLVRPKLDDVLRKELKQCHILFIMSSYKGSIMELLYAIGNNPVLVVGETSSFPTEGGMIGLSVNKGHIGISVNLDAVEKKDLSISAQLLQHAIIVKSR